MINSVTQVFYHSLSVLAMQIPFFVLFWKQKGGRASGDHHKNHPTGGGRLHRPPHLKGKAPLFLPRHLPADPGGERHPGERQPRPHHLYSPHRGHFTGGNRRPPPAQSGGHPRRLASPHCLGGRPPAGGEQARRDDSPRLQLPAGHPHRGWPGAGARTSCSTR